jgi:succinyl-CoA synthetase beta subunit
MNLHEYQAKKILASSKIRVPNGKVVKSPTEADSYVSAHKGNTFAIKAQIHAGGRGLSGGVKIISSAKEASNFTNKFLGTNLVTYQNEPYGQPVNSILIEETVSINQELYFSIIIDRQTEAVTIICSTAGGMEIEEISIKNPELIFTVSCEINKPLNSKKVKEVISSLSLNDKVAIQFNELLCFSYKLFIDNDLSLLEINPLVITDNNELIALDCKMSVDDNALFKHTEIKGLHDWSQLDSKEKEAHYAGLNYIALDGSIGCMVNGAGLAMATMDLIKLSGGSPANFLDVGGGATSETVSKALKILISDNNVRVVLVNIFGGIMRCDIIANGIINAVIDVGIKIPIVVRLEGTNVELGKETLNDSKLNIISADSLTDAANKAVEIANGK